MKPRLFQIIAAALVLVAGTGFAATPDFPRDLVITWPEVTTDDTGAALPSAINEYRLYECADMAAPIATDPAPASTATVPVSSAASCAARSMPRARPEITVYPASPRSRAMARVTLNSWTQNTGNEKYRTKAYKIVKLHDEIACQTQIPTIPPTT